MFKRRTVRPCALLVCGLLVAQCSATTPYVLYDESNAMRDGNGGFSLCLGASPNQELRESLLMCRELSYEFCVNSSLVGSVLRVDGATARHFVASLNEPTEDNIVRLAELIDSALVLLYDSFSTQSTAHVKCAHAWRGWVCSRAFKRAAQRSTDGRGGLPLPLCANACQRAEMECNADLQCADRSDVTLVEKEQQCTDFYADSDKACDKSATAKNQKVPVFRKHDKEPSSSWTWNNSAYTTLPHAQPMLYIILFMAYLATIACR